MTRDEHLAWCKARAQTYVDAGDWPKAIASMGSDLSKHPETAGLGEHVLYGTRLAANGVLDPRWMQNWLDQIQ